MSKFIKGLARYRKGIVVILGGVSMVVATGQVHGTGLEIANGVLALATALGVIGVPNAPAAPAHAD